MANTIDREYIKYLLKIWIAGLKSPASILTMISVVYYAILAWVWHTFVLYQEKGTYSPFEANLSYIRYVGIITGLNLLITLFAYRRDRLWVYLPLIFNLIILIFTTYYLFMMLRFE